MQANKNKILLENYHSEFEEELENKIKMLQLLKYEPICYTRDLLEGHFTASAFIVNAAQNKTLLIKHLKLNKWLQPGGHCDGDSNLLNVALKEAQEETGLQNFIYENKIFDLDIHTIPERKGVPEHKHYDVRFLLTANESDSLVISDESVDLQWILLAEVPNFNGETSILRMVQKIKG